MMDSEILKLICANQGAVCHTELMYNLCPGDPSELSEVLANSDKLVLCTVNNEERVVARCKLFLCRVKDCSGGCRGLHTCKRFLMDESCQFGRLRRPCTFPHDLNSEHNQKMLTAHGLQILNRAELCTLLLQSDNTLLPQVCHDYNNGFCQNGDDCLRLHICENFCSQLCICPKDHDFTDPQPRRLLHERGVPDSLFRCMKSTYANKAALLFADKLSVRVGKKMTQSAEGDRGRGRGRGKGGGRGRPPLSRASSLSNILNTSRLSLHNESDILKFPQRGSPTDNSDARSDTGEYRRFKVGRGRGVHRGNLHHSQRSDYGHDFSADVQDEGAVGGAAANKRQRQRPGRDKAEICIYFLKGHCKHKDRCIKVHDKMPYRWQVKQSGQWTALPNNESIEKDYCDPKNLHSSRSRLVQFHTMTCGDNKVRRLSTVSSVTEPTLTHATEWLWYWQSEFGKWNLYASDKAQKQCARIDSASLEQMFLNNDKDVVEFSTGSQSYLLSFKDMTQTNGHFGTVSAVCRRPRFVSAEEVGTKKTRRPPLAFSAGKGH